MFRRFFALLALTSLVASAVLTGSATGSSPNGDYRHGSVYAQITDTEIALGNPLIERKWSRDGFGTIGLTDQRGWTSSMTPGRPDFRLFAGSQAAPQVLSSDLFQADSVTVTEIERGLQLDITLTPIDPALSPGLSITRTLQVYNGIAGIRASTVIESAVPLALRGYTLDEVPASGAPTIHAFRAGADWREPDWGGPSPHESWPGPPSSIGDSHPGTWRDTKTAGEGQALAAAGQWISVEQAGSDVSTVFSVMERNDFPSSRAEYKSGTASLIVDHSADIVSAGPFEESVHAENPQPGHAGRVRVVKPLQPYAMEASFTGVSKGIGDEAWQFHKYLIREQLEEQSHDITFNSNGTDGNVISTGAKDDMSYAVVQEVAPKAKALGIETFILDDGWQAKSGEWFPDCKDEATGEEHLEPRHDADPVKFAPRFPDCTFEAVREAIAPMKLGLWMNPMHYHPTASTDDEHPDWICQPVGSALHLYNTAEPTSSSNEAGLAQWGPNAIPHVEQRIRVMIEEWDVKYFKFDFLAWLDCAGQGDLYEYKEAFGAMLDRLIADHEDVTFTVDETNDYRLFPFESVNRGASWFQNGSPPPHQLLHNLWNLSPWIPASYIGQHFLGGGQYNNYSVDTLMAAALTSHMTFFSDLRPLPDHVVEQAAPWTAFYKANREALTQMVYPLLNDPMTQDWTALQSWNPEEGFGALLAFRQNADEATTSISLTNVPAGRSFDLFAAPTGEFVRTVTSEELSAGIEVSLPEKNTAQVYVIRPHVEIEAQ